MGQTITVQNIITQNKLSAADEPRLISAINLRNNYNNIIDVLSNMYNKHLWWNSYGKTIFHTNAYLANYTIYKPTNTNSIISIARSATTTLVTQPNNNILVRDLIHATGLTSNHFIMLSEEQFNTLRDFSI